LDFCKFVEELDGKVYDEQTNTYCMKAYPMSTKNLKLKLYLQNLLDNMRTNCLTLDLVTQFRNRETQWNSLPKGNPRSASLACSALQRSKKVRSRGQKQQISADN